MRDIKVFCGWSKLKNVFNTCSLDITKLLFLTLFKTGGRCNEVLTVTREQCDIVDEYITVIDMPVLKRHLSYVPMRTVPVILDEQLTTEWINLMPAEGKFFDFKYDKAYKLMRDLEKPKTAKHGPWYPHRFRAERARQLVRDYKFDALLLKQFFDMARLDTPIHYANPSLEAVKRAMKK